MEERGRERDGERVGGGVKEDVDEQKHHRPSSGKGFLLMSVALCANPCNASGTCRLSITDAHVAPATIRILLAHFHSTVARVPRKREDYYVSRLGRKTLRELRFWAAPLDVCRCQAVTSRQAVELPAGDCIAFSRIVYFFHVYIWKVHGSSAVQPGEAAAGAEHRPVGIGDRDIYTAPTHTHLTRYKLTIYNLRRTPTCSSAPCVL